MNLRATWHRFWFDPRPADLLGFCRLLFFALVLQLYLPFDFTAWGDVPPSMANNAIFFQRLFHVPLLTAKHLAMVELLWKGSMIFACVGLLTRTAMWVNFLTITYLLSVPGRFGKMGHGEGILILTSLILACSRAGDAWSIDALRKSYRRRDVQELRPASGEYTWPIKMVWLLMSLIFLAAGVTKLRLGGLAWITTDNLSNMILQHQAASYSSLPNRVGLWIADHKSLCKWMAGGTIFVELFFGLSLFSGWARLFFVPAMYLAQLGIYVMMGVSFSKFTLVYLFFVPWDRIAISVRRPFAVRRPLTFLYDGGCGLCTSVASVGRRIDLLNRVQFLDAVHEWPRIQERFPMLDRERCLNDIHLVDSAGNVFTRFAAYRRAMWVLPQFWLTLPLMYLPPVPQIADRIYGYVALHRHDKGCALP